MSVALFFFWKSALHSFHLVKVEEGRVSFKYFRRNQELTRQQIKDVSLVSRRSRRAVTKSFVQIETQEGNRYLFSRFPEGNEIMYGYLRDWWSASKNS